MIDGTMVKARGGRAGCAGRGGLHAPGGGLTTARTLLKKGAAHAAPLQIYAWYDNEWGYSCRMVDVVRMVARSL